MDLRTPLREDRRELLELLGGLAEEEWLNADSLRRMAGNRSSEWRDADMDYEPSEVG